MAMNIQTHGYDQNIDGIEIAEGEIIRDAIRDALPAIKPLFDGKLHLAVVVRYLDNTCIDHYGLGSPFAITKNQTIKDVVYGALPNDIAYGDVTAEISAWIEFDLIDTELSETQKALLISSADIKSMVKTPIKE